MFVFSFQKVLFPNKKSSVVQKKSNIFRFFPLMRETLLLLLSFSLSFGLFPDQRCGNAVDGPNLWVNWVTNSSSVSYWDNHKQVAEEWIQYPHKRMHPYGEETHFDLRRYVINAPVGWAFFLNVMGDFKLCPNKGCFFFVAGLEPLPLSSTSHYCDTRLNSYNETQTQVDFVNCIYDNNMDPSKCPPLDYNDFVSSFQADYNYGFNETAGEVVFFGEGRGVTSDGLFVMVLQETIAPDYVAPLELFYNISDGNCVTSYTTPIVYRVLPNPPFWKH